MEYFFKKVPIFGRKNVEADKYEQEIIYKC